MFYVNATGVGRPIVDLLTTDRLRPVPCYFNHEDRVTETDSHELIGKALLVARASGPGAGGPYPTRLHHLPPDMIHPEMTTPDPPPPPQAAPQGRFRLSLAKQDFKFSVAHFTVFSAGEAERLHGHNYRLSVDLEGVEVGELGLLADVSRVKAEIRAICAELDSRTVLPTESPLVSVTEVANDGDGAKVEVRYEGRRYLLPAADVVLLPLANTTMELFARYLWLRLAPGLAGSGVERMMVAVEETDGQRCAYEAPLPAAG